VIEEDQLKEIKPKPAIASATRRSYRCWNSNS